MTKSRGLAVIIQRWAKNSNQIESPTFLNDLDNAISDAMEKAYEKGITCILDCNGHGDTFKEYNNIK